MTKPIKTSLAEIATYLLLYAFMGWVFSVFLHGLGYHVAFLTCWAGIVFFTMLINLVTGRVKI